MSGPRTGMPPPFAPAQTPVQLYEQMQHRGVAEADMRAIRGACGLALRMFAGVLQASGRAQLQHCIGVASALLDCGAPADLVAAGLLHSAYRRGDFGAWRVTLAQKRRWLRGAVGDSVESHVFAVHHLPWSPDAVVELPARFDSLDALDRAAVLVRLCDELDSAGSLGYRVDADRLLREAAVKRAALIDLADKLALPALGEALDAALDGALRAGVPAELRFRRTETVLPPASAKLRPEAAFARAIARGLRRPRGGEGQSGAPSPRRR